MHILLSVNEPLNVEIHNCALKKPHSRLTQGTNLEVGISIRFPVTINNNFVATSVSYNFNVTYSSCLELYSSIPIAAS